MIVMEEKIEIKEDKEKKVEENNNEDDVEEEEEEEEDDDNNNEKDEKEEQEEQKKRKIKLLGQKISVATMKIEILQNYKKNINISKIKKKIEYNKIYCNNDLKRLKDNYYMNINFHMNQLKYMKMKNLIMK